MFINIVRANLSGFVYHLYFRADLVPMFHFGENETYIPATGICLKRLRNMQVIACYQHLIPYISFDVLVQRNFKVSHTDLNNAQKIDFQSNSSFPGPHNEYLRILLPTSFGEKYAWTAVSRTGATTVGQFLSITFYK